VLNSPKFKTENLKLAQAVTKSVRGKVPVDTGKLRITIDYVLTKEGFTVGAGDRYADYAAPLEAGRRAVTINAVSTNATTKKGSKGKGFLAFQIGGRFVYTQQVKQKARKGTFFIRDSARLYFKRVVRRK